MCFIFMNMRYFVVFRTKKEPYKYQCYKCINYYILLDFVNENKHNWIDYQIGDY